MVRPFVSKRPLIHIGTRRKAMPREILVDMIIGSIVFGVIYDITKNMLRKQNDTTTIETVEAVVVDEDSDDDMDKRIIVSVTVDTEITDTDSETHLP